MQSEGGIFRLLWSPNNGFKFDESATFIVADGSYANQSVKGTATIQKCSNGCEKDQ